MAFDILSCGIIFCSGDTEAVPDDSNSAAKNAIGALYFFSCIILSLLFGGMFLRLYDETNPHVNMVTAKSNNLSASPSKYRKRGPPTMSKVTSRDNLIGEPSQSNLFSSPSAAHMHKSALDDMVKRQEQQRALKYSSACLEIPCATNGKTVELFPLYLVFGVLYPILIVASMVLPTWWAGFSSNGLKTYAASKPDRINGPYFHFQLNKWVVLKLFPDILAYNLAIYLVALTALLSKGVPNISRILNSTFLLPNPFGVSRWIVKVGEGLLFAVFVFLIIFQFCYFYMYHAWENKSNADRVNAELAARAMGQVSNLLTGLLLLPVSRNSVWTIVFGVSHKIMLGWHKYTGVLVLVSTSVHAILWCFAYSAYGYFPQELFSISDRQFHPYNFTVPLAVLGFVAMTMCWYYITAGLTLWIVDYYLRINRVFNNSAALQTCRVVVPNNQLTGSSGIIELAYLMQRKKRLVDKSKLTQSASSSSFSLASSSGEIEMKALNREIAYLEIGAEVDLDDSIVEDVVREKQLLREKTEKDRSTELLLVSERALKHRIGQYVLINIPSIDLFAWHPFSIASAPSEPGGSTTHFIQAMRPNEWTGPYGTPLDLTRYTHIVLIAGGIGITPVYSCYRQIYLQMLAKYLDFKGPHANTSETAYEAAHFAEDAMGMRVRKVSLCWSVKNRSTANILEDKITEMSHSALSYGSEKAFDFSLYLTKEEPPLNRYPSAASNAGSSIDEFVNILHPNYEAVQMMKDRDNLTVLEENCDLSSEVKMEGLYNNDGTHGLNESDDGLARMDESLPPSESHVYYGRPDLKRMISQLAADTLYRRDESILIFACGPEGLVNDCEELAHLHSVDFRGEKFQM
eukprot:gene24395-32842_t